MFGKHMDVMPASRGQGSSTTYLAAAVMFITNTAGNGVWSNGSYNNFYALKVPAEPSGLPTNPTNNNKTIRFGWQLQIELVDDVNQFLNLNEIG